MSLKSLFLWLLESERSRKLYQFGALPLKDFNSSLGSLTSNLFFYFHFWMWDYFRSERFIQVFEQIPYLWVKLLTLSLIKLIRLRELNYQKVPFFSFGGLILKIFESMFLTCLILLSYFRMWADNCVKFCFLLISVYVIKLSIFSAKAKGI